MTWSQKGEPIGESLFFKYKCLLGKINPVLKSKFVVT